jgi:hypothetical protein
LTDTENKISELILGYFSKINAKIVENNGLFTITIPEEYEKLFTTELKITFDKKISEQQECELITPGSNTFYKIIKTCIDFGPVIIAKTNSSSQVNTVLRFYFYVILESVRTKTKLCIVDVDIKTQNILDLGDVKLESVNKETIEINIKSDTIDDCYISAIEYVEKIIKPEINEFKKLILNLKQDELDSINKEYNTRKNEIQKESIIIQQKPNSSNLLNDLILENESIKNDMKKAHDLLDSKYSITIDFALISAAVLV